ncbi:MAG: hypothetical protein HOP33_01695 [Verrucomicrobia bacterium]|nr:hypothetical protein [Verrucomicrobiota bacterium]
MRTGDQSPKSGDYYFEPDGLMVFTAAYHLRRGCCCENDCRHCPYHIQPASTRAGECHKEAKTNEA